jgi:hypothetical protein
MNNFIIWEAFNLQNLVEGSSLNKKKNYPEEHLKFYRS